MKILLLLLLSLFFLGTGAQQCSHNVVIVGIESVLFETVNPTQRDTSKIEIAAAAWTCNSVPCSTRSTIKYNLDGIPVNAVVTKAELYLYAKPTNLNGQTGNPTFGTANTTLLQRIVTSWQPATVSWNNQPAVTTADNKILPQSTGTRQNYVVNMTDFVQFWINKPDSNFGALLRLQNEQYYNSMVFYAGQAPADSLLPKLAITYSVPSEAQLVITGDTADNTFTQVLFETVNPTQRDTSQIEIAAAAWTCNAAPCATRSIIKYNLDQIPVNSIITSAKLHLFAKPTNLNGQTGNPTFGTANTSVLQRIISQWQPGSVSWNNSPAVTTANSEILPQSSSTRQNYTLDVTDFTQFWVNKPDSNFGALLRLQNEQYYNSMVFYSGQAPHDSLKPRLVICYRPNSTVPLKLTGFSANAEGKKNILKWTSENEINMDRFEIERSSTSRDFIKIGTVKSGLRSYDFTDAAPLPGSNYYRLKIVDKDGKFVYSTIKLVNSTKSFRASIFPNPAKNNLNVVIESRANSPLLLQVIAEDGKVLISQKYTTEAGMSILPVTVSTLKKGCYFLNIMSGDKQLQVLKFGKF